MNKRLFPRDFYWGVSTAAHQVDGGAHDQWTVWELANAAELAKTARKKWGWLPRWHAIAKRASDPHNYVSGKGVEHYQRYKEDFAIAKTLNCNSFRFGIEWSRLEPKPGVWDDEVWEHYRKYLAALRAQGLEPFLNIWHWTMPVWFVEKGAFAKKANLQYWERFIAKLVDELPMGELSHVITLNEPNVYASFGYLTAEWPPQDRNIIKFVQVYWHLVKAHKIAYKILKKSNQDIQVGIASQLANIQAKRPHHIYDQIATKWMRYFWNWWFINRVRRYQDFVGFNYYFTDYYRGFKRDNPHVPLNDMGWYMEPEGLYPLLLRVWAHYKKPIFVTENGVADENDQHRQWWLQETMIALERALSEGVNVKGYFHWSLLDNFEWAYGWWPKFGLVSVDREHGMKREARPSARWWAKKLKQIQENDEQPA